MEGVSMDDNNRNVPKLRFPGFTDAWEQRKLGDRMYIKSRIGWQALTRDEYLEMGDYYLITGTDIDESSHTVDLKRCYYVSKERYEMDDKIQVREGDIIVTKDGTIGKVAMVTGLDKPATLNSHLFVLRDLSGNLDNRYLLQMLNSHIFDAFVNSTKTGSTLTGLPQKTFVEFQFPVPSYEEQKLIADLFDNLDNLITLHQRKYCVAKMAVIKPKKLHILVYSTNEWEQRKFGDVFEEYSEKNHSELPALTIIQGGGTILREESDRNLQYDKSNLSGYKMVRKNDFIVHLRSFEGGLEKANSDGIISPAYHTFHGEQTDSRFFYPYFRSRYFIDVLLKPHVYGIRDGRSIDIDGMKTILLKVPSYAEQKRIGEFIESIDNLITLHQCKPSSIQNKGG